jgi:hypothetical protein
VDRERAALVLQRLQIRQELSLAWIAAQAVEQREILLTELLAENQRLQDSLPLASPAAPRQAGDLLVAQQEALTLTDRRDDLQRTGPRPGPRCGAGWAPGPTKHCKAIQARSLAPSRNCAQNWRITRSLNYPAMQSMARAEVPRSPIRDPRRLGLGDSL